MRLFPRLMAFLFGSAAPVQPHNWRDTDTSAFHLGCHPAGTSSAFIESLRHKGPLPAVRKLAAHDLLKPEYARTREGLILRELMNGRNLDHLGARRLLCRYGHDCKDCHREINRLEACLRRSCIRCFKGKEIRNGRPYTSWWLSQVQIKALKELAGA